MCTNSSYQYHQCHVTQPLLREQLTEWGIDISAGQIDALLTAGKEEETQYSKAVIAPRCTLLSVMVAVLRMSNTRTAPDLNPTDREYWTEYSGEDNEREQE